MRIAGIIDGAVAECTDRQARYWRACAGVQGTRLEPRCSARDVANAEGFAAASVRAAIIVVGRHVLTALAQARPYTADERPAVLEVAARCAPLDGRGQR